MTEEELCNFQDAVDIAAEMAGIESEQKIVGYGRKLPFELFISIFAREFGHVIAETFLETSKPRVGLSSYFM